MPAETYILKQCESWPDVNERLEKAVDTTLAHIDYTDNTEISLVLANDDFIQGLNKNYRDKDKPTNVLSFPQEDEEFGNLGDVIFAFETIQKEAEEQKKSFEDHLTHLAVHGTLHLLGYDHELDDQAEEMEALEIQILQTLDIKNPYEQQD